MQNGRSFSCWNILGRYIKDPMSSTLTQLVFIREIKIHDGYGTKLINLIKIRIISLSSSLFWRINASLPSTVATEPLFRQLLLLYTFQVEPLSLAKSVVAHHHLSIRRAPAVAILGLVRVILPLSSLYRLSGSFFTSFSA